MNFEFIHRKVIEVYDKCNVSTFPIDCFDILIQYGFTLKTYQTIKLSNPELYKNIINYTDDAFQFGMTIYYNENSHRQRIRFSLMHELGHFILNHSKDSNTNEYEANYFASVILAPSMAIHYSGCKNLNDVAKLFDLSFEASDIAFTRYKRWHRHVVYYKMTVNDKLMYKHFYSAQKECFIWSKKKCTCGRIYYNSTLDQCPKCKEMSEYWKKLDLYLERTSRSYDEPEYIPGFNHAEQQREMLLMHQYDLI